MHIRYDIVSVATDVVTGSLVGWFMATYFGQGPVWFIVFGIFAALAPDIDFIIHLYRNNWKVDKFSHEHRDIFHNPLLFSFALGYIAYLFAGAAIASVWVAATLGHFIHDTFSGGWGVRWLYPLYEAYFTLVPYSPQRIIPNRIVQRKLAEKFGTSDWMDPALIPFTSKQGGSDDSATGTS